MVKKKVDLSLLDDNIAVVVVIVVIIVADIVLVHVVVVNIIVVVLLVIADYIIFIGWMDWWVLSFGSIDHSLSTVK